MRALPGLAQDPLFWGSRTVLAGARDVGNSVVLAAGEGVPRLGAGEDADGVRVILVPPGGQLHSLMHTISVPFFLPNPEKRLPSAPHL